MAQKNGAEECCDSLWIVFRFLWNSFFCLDFEGVGDSFFSMTTKELVLETVRELPDDASWSEIEDRIRFLAAIETSRQEVRDGKLLPHEEVRDLLRSWTTP